MAALGVQVKAPATKSFGVGAVQNRVLKNYRRLITAPNFRASRVILQPGDIVVARRGPGLDELLLRLQRGGSVWITPLVNLGMAVTKRESASSIMIEAGQILNKFVQNRVSRIETVHIGRIISPVDDVLAFIDKQESLGGSGCAQFRNIGVL